MNLDLISLGLVVVAALLGAMAGGLLQLTHIAAILVAGFLCRPVGAQLGPPLAARFGQPMVVGVLGTTVLCFFLIYSLVHVVARMILKRVVQNPSLSTADRALGFILAGGKAAGLLFVILSALIFFEKPLTSVSRLHFDTSGSMVAGLVRSHNLFSTFSFPGVKGITALSRGLGDPQAAARLAQDPAFKQLTSDPRIQAILADGALRRSVQSGDYVSMLRNNRVLEALTDPMLQQRLAQIGDSAAAPHSSK